MGLISLRQKISGKLKNISKCSEEDVVYILIEIRKYLERSRKDLGDVEDLKLKESDYPAVKFFRNWVAHPEKHDSDIPKEILKILNETSSGNSQHTEVELFTLLINELDKFHKEINPSTKPVEEWGNFFESLKRVLSEQPIKISDKNIIIEYNDSLNLIRRDKNS